MTPTLQLTILVSSGLYKNKAPPCDGGNYAMVLPYIALIRSSRLGPLEELLIYFNGMVLNACGRG